MDWLVVSRAHTRAMQARQCESSGQWGGCLVQGTANGCSSLVSHGDPSKGSVVMGSVRAESSRRSFDADSVTPEPIPPKYPDVEALNSSV